MRIAIEFLFLDEIGDGEPFSVELKRAIGTDAGLSQHAEELSRVALQAGADAAHRRTAADDHQRHAIRPASPQQPTDRVDPRAVGRVAADFGRNAEGDNPVHDFPR